ncbi:pectinesterase 4-like [Nicotiana tabacum]|uniref:Pectinesterase n=1 Tax=Nicotiana tabacum TaxID=4097 RepID=A0A1S3XCW1_TOBAC|nr:PREDICTED: pectinesterase-like [Nicotiana tabacum]
MVGKIVVSLVSLILLVGVIVGVVVVVHKNGDNDDDKSTKVQMKKVDEFCQPTSFKDACVQSLDKVASNDSATIKDYIMAAFEYTVQEIKKSLHETGKTNVNKESDPYNHMAVEDCKVLLEDAIEELESTLKKVSENEMKSLNDKVYDILTYVSAVYSYQSECIDSIDKPEYKSAIEKYLVNSTQLSNNAIDIVAKISSALQSSGFQIPDGLLNRKLLEANYQIGHDNYPTWFPVADRKLLANTPTPHAIVAKDGSGKFKTVSDALKAYPQKHQGKYIVYVKAGVYNEQVLVDKKQPNVFIFGDGAGKTIITSDKNVAILKFTTMNSATFGVNAPGFVAKGITFRNTAGPKGQQAVALRIQGDQSAVFDCNIEGYQDTLYYQSKRQFYRNCVISGTIDFIFGRGTAVIQDSTIILRKPGADQKWNTITADGREVESQPTGVALQNCKIVAEKELIDTKIVENFLGRPWKALSTNVVMESEIGGFIKPEGWMIWDKEHFEQTCECYEYANRGPGAATNARNKVFKKFKVLSPQEATKYTAGAVWFQGKEWLPATGAPFYLGLGGK